MFLKGCCAGPPAIQSESKINVLVDPPGPFRYLSDFILQSVGEAALKASLSTLQASETAAAEGPRLDVCKAFPELLQHHHIEAAPRSHAMLVAPVWLQRRMGAQTFPCCRELRALKS